MGRGEIAGPRQGDRIAHRRERDKYSAGCVIENSASVILTSGGIIHIHLYETQLNFLCRIFFFSSSSFSSMGHWRIEMEALYAAANKCMRTQTGNKMKGARLW